VAQQTATMVRLRNGTEEVVELLDANTQLVAMVAKQRETMARLRARITRLLSFTTQLTAHFDSITGSTLSASHANADDTAAVLWDTATDTSFLIQLNRDSEVDVNFLRNPKTTKELEAKLALLHAKRNHEKDLWMYFDSGASRSVISTTSPIRKHLTALTPTYGSCSIGNGTPLQYIEKGLITDNLEITVVNDLKFDLFSSVNAAKQGLTSIIDYDLKTGKNNSYTLDKITGSVTPLIERGKGILELPLHLMIPTGICLALTPNQSLAQPELSPNLISMFWHHYDDKRFDPTTRENNLTEYSLFTFDIIKSLSERERDFLIHARLGHLPRKKILQMIKNGTTGIGTYSGKFKELCKPCMQAK
jgi:hypothetical protein